MGSADIATLPEDVLRHIAEYHLKHGHGLKQWCKIASAFPGLPDIPLPRVTLSQLAQERLPWGGEQNLLYPTACSVMPWKAWCGSLLKLCKSKLLARVTFVCRVGIKWALLRQPSASILEISVQRTRSLVGGLGEPHHVQIWGGPIQEIQEECDEEVEAVIEMSEDKRGLRSLVLRLFPVHEDDGKNLPVERILLYLQPWVQRLLQLGFAHIQGLKLDADVLFCPELLAKLPLRHLELNIGKSSTAHLKEIMMALGQCSALEYLVISVHAAFENLTQVKLPDLCLHNAANLKHVSFHACFPGGNLCLPPGCQLRLDLVQYYKGSWDYKWRSGNGGDLMECMPALCLAFFDDWGESWPSHIHNFKALQYLHMERPPLLTDLAILQDIPHVRLELSQDSLLHTAGSWQSLEIKSYDGFGISFAEIDAFVRENRRYIFETYHTPKFWRNMKDALTIASDRQGVGCFPSKVQGYERVCSIQEVASSGAHVASVEDFWPKQSMQTCLALAAPSPRADISQCKCRPSNLKEPHFSSSVTEDISTIPVIPGPDPPILERSPGFKPGVCIVSGPGSSLNALPKLNYAEHAGQLHVSESPFNASTSPILLRPDTPTLEPKPAFKPCISNDCGPVSSLNALSNFVYTEHAGELRASPFVASVLPIISRPGPPILEPRLPVVKPDISNGCGPVSRPKALPNLNYREHASRLTLRGCLAWLAHRLKPTRITMRCARCVVVEAPGEAI